MVNGDKASMFEQDSLIQEAIGKVAVGGFSHDAQYEGTDIQEPGF